MMSDTAITDCHSDTTIFQLRAHWERISWSIGSEKLFGHVPPVGDKRYLRINTVLYMLSNSHMTTVFDSLIKQSPKSLKYF